MFEPNMDEYLDEEIESAKQAFETICKEWERQVGPNPTGSFRPVIRTLPRSFQKQLQQRQTLDSYPRTTPRKSNAMFLRHSQMSCCSL